MGFAGRQRFVAGQKRCEAFDYTIHRLLLQYIFLLRNRRATIGSMFSYRHAFHAGSHADVFKHTALIAALKHLTQKDAALTVIDTHAGAGLYRLDGDYSTKGGEAADGVVKLFAAVDDAEPPVAALQDYLELVKSFNATNRLVVYPGSPFVIHQLLRPEARDRLKLFELHPTDARTLSANIAQLEAGRQISVAQADGFASLPPLLPPPARRALVLIDPSYEMKSDYARVATCVDESLKRFATGCYLIWYPVIARPEAHELPKRLKTLAQRARRSWLSATFAIGQSEQHTSAVVLPGERASRPGLTASGLFVVNPPHALEPALRAVLPQLLARLGRGRGQAFAVDSGGG